MDDYDGSILSDGDSDSDESAEIQSLIDSYCNEDIDQDDKSNSIKTIKDKKNNKPKKKRKKGKQNSLDHLRERVTELMTIFEDKGLFIPLPPSLSEKGKVWSSRIYGADKKRSRKNAERHLLEDRIEQLEHVLQEEHGIDIAGGSAA